MEFPYLKLIILLNVFAFVGSYAASPSEIYWNTVLPNNPMPKAIKDLLPSSDMESKGVSVGVGGGGVNVNVPGGTNVNVGQPGGGGGGGGVHVNAPGGTNVNVGPGRGGPGGNKPGGTNVNVGHGGSRVHVKAPGGTNVNVGPGSGGTGGNKPGGINVNVGHGGDGVQVKAPGETNVNVGRGGGGGASGGTNVNAGKDGDRVGVEAHEDTDVNVGVSPGGTNVGVDVGRGPHHKGKPVNVGVFPRGQPFLYNYAATKDQLHDNPNVALFFLEKNIAPGSTMNLHFFKTSNGSRFLPRKVAESIPFSSNKLGDIFNRFSVDSQSQEARLMKNTIKECEAPRIQGEQKICATSLESMVDFSTSRLGKNIEVLSTTAIKESPMQKYTITGVKKMATNKAVACHRQNYVYAVFYCHETQSTRAYTVSMVGADGTKVKAVAVCHEDTTKWNPKHLAFQVLKVKPGQIPICHFLPEDHIVWVPK
ncbi:OLC1v1028974C1 [Oldenlandia corymbosa var. corymbosa]|uniref:OLC1v1028974C1 n=1 Tax=Oldenlandia corymbosa var. corymbosa TaxID=529605 RepID=A0AAV1CDD9_OLDCO|nr:OLC1v1028974C1 [Oldenlandia corymbosa var. corymbosa]